MPAPSARRPPSAARRRGLLVVAGGLIAWLLARQGRRSGSTGWLESPSRPHPTRLEGTGPTGADTAGSAPPARRRRRVAGWVAVAVVVAVGLVAAARVYAYATGSGVGVGAVQVDPSQPLTIAPGTAVDPLFPGASANVVATISNPNAVAVHVPALGIDATQGSAGGFGADPAHAACNLDSLRFDGPQTDGGQPFVVPPKGSLEVDLADAVSMDATAADACQGATLTVYLQVVP